VPILAAFAAVFLLFMAYKAGESAGAAIWPAAALAVIAFAFVCLWAWHRRRMAELYHLRLEHLSRYEQVNKLRPWPKFCHDCGAEFNGWKTASIHDDPETSSCALLAKKRDELAAEPALPMRGFTAEVLDPPPGPADADRAAAEFDELTVRQPLDRA
jgi:hypothetical protein